MFYAMSRRNGKRKSRQVTDDEWKEADLLLKSVVGNDPSVRLE